ncbi:hypothetical protein C7212DRAFT_18600, partial [Tuber magnatum]
RSLHLHRSCADRAVGWVRASHTHTHLHWRDAATRDARVNSREGIVVDVPDAFLEGSSAGGQGGKGDVQI